MQINKEDWIVFCDFDGTISEEDVLDKVFNHFGDEEVHKLEEKFKQGVIDDKETLIKKWQRISLSEKKFKDFIFEQVRLDPFFDQFYNLLKKQGIKLIIVSGGFNNYIKLLLKDLGLTREVEVFGNYLEFKNGLVIPHFLHDIDSCHQHFGVCGSCKYQVLNKYKTSGKKYLYIGDGLTDRCPAEEADLVLAKKGELLEEYCQQNEISYFSFANFKEVIEILDLKN